MLELFGLLFSWLPDKLLGYVIAFISIFVLVFFVGIILKVIEIIRG